MGRFDGPRFRTCADPAVVSVWLATRPPAQMPEGYFAEYDGDDDEHPFNPFSADFGFGFYDHDFVEDYCPSDEQPLPVAELLAPCSYSESFGADAAARARELGIERSAHVFLMYDFAYDPSVTGVDRSDYLRFIGTFRYRSGQD